MRKLGGEWIGRRRRLRGFKSLLLQCSQQQLSVALAARFGRVIASDPAQAQLDHAVPDPRVESKRRLIELSGEIPSPVNPPSGCRFHTRCPIAVVPGICADEEPPIEEKSPGRFAACHFSERVRTEL